MSQPDQTLKPGRPARWRGLVALGCVAAYVVSYACLSWQGAYIGHNRGGNDNRETWFAAHCAETYRAPTGRHKVRLTALGWFYLPLVLVDQMAVHRTRADGFARPLQAPLRSDALQWPHPWQSVLLSVGTLSCWRGSLTAGVRSRQSPCGCGRHPFVVEPLGGLRGVSRPAAAGQAGRLKPRLRTQASAVQAPSLRRPAGGSAGL
jgi:hypothetical protein